MTTLNFIVPAIESIARLEMLLDVLLKGLVVLAVAGALNVALTRAAAAARHLVWTLALGGLLALPLLAMVLPNWGSDASLLPSLRPAAPALMDEFTAASAQSVRFNAELSSAGLDDISIDTAPLAPVSDSAARVTAEPVKRSWTLFHLPHWSRILLYIWMAGALLVLTRLAAGLARMWAVNREAEFVTDYRWTILKNRLARQFDLPGDIPLLTSDRIGMPMTWGVWQAVILLPADADNWSDELREIVLLHELAHVRRLDCLTQMLAQLACALHWFNPLVWVAARRLRVERELACDDYVLRVGTRASDYAGHLVHMAKTAESHGDLSPVAAGSIGVAMACSQLESRVRAILDPAIRRRGLTRRIAMAMALLSLCAIMPLASLQLWAGAQQPNKQKRAAAPFDVPKPGDKQQQRQADRETDLDIDSDIADLAEKQAELAARLAAIHDGLDIAGSVDASEIEEALADAREMLSDDKLRAELERARALAGKGGQAAKLSAGMSAKLAAELAATGRTLVSGEIEAALAETAAQAGRLTSDRIRERIDGKLLQSLDEAIDDLEKEKDKNKDKDKDKDKAGKELEKLRKMSRELSLAYQGQSQGGGRASGGGVSGGTSGGVAGGQSGGVAIAGSGQNNSDKPMSGIDALIRLKTAGVTPEYIESLRAAGFADLSARDLIQLRTHGIDAAFIQQAAKWGNEKPTVRELTQLKISGITPEYVEAMKKAGYNLPISSLSKMRMYGVTPEFIATMKRLGYDNLTADQITKLRMHGVTEQYLKEMRDAGYDKLDVEEITRLRMHGVNPAYVKEMRDAGFDKLTVRQLTNARMHGVTPAYVKEMREAGFDKATLEELTKMRMHGLTADYVRKMKGLGLKNISANDLLRMKISGVDDILLKSK
ncbi:MAG: M56 family metallopeptidase [Blastocatellia bacterium]